VKRILVSDLYKIKTASGVKIFFSRWKGLFYFIVFRPAVAFNDAKTGEWIIKDSGFWLLPI